MENRLKLIRKIRKVTQQQVATHMNISQNTYSYWENGKVNISNDDMQKLATFFRVSADFLSGRQYTLRSQPHSWREDLYADYMSAPAEHKIFMEYLYGNISYFDSEDTSESIDNFGPLTDQEQQLLHMFRSTTEEGRMRIVSAVVNICDQMEEKRIAPSIEKNA